MGNLIQDVKYGLRMLAKNPGFTAVAVLTLAFGIGATTAIFSVVSSVLLRPLPFRDPDRLVQFGTTSVADLEDCREQSRSFESIVTYQVINQNLQDVDEPERIATVAAERGLFDLLGVAPLAGRTFNKDDASDLAVVIEGFWKRQFGPKINLNGRKFTLDGKRYTVIGVMPQWFEFPYRASPAEVWIQRELPRSDSRVVRVDAAIGRLKPAVTFAQARAELNTIAQRIEALYPKPDKGSTFTMSSLTEAVVGKSETALLVLLGAVAMVLLIACANVMSLLLARSESRKHEVAVRTALGASRNRLVRQFLTESVLLAMSGGLAGLMVTIWGTRLLFYLAGPQIPRASEIGLDWRVFLFLLVVSVATGIGSGLAPALKATSGGVTVVLNESGGRSSAGRSSSTVTKGLVVAEIALTFVLLIGAGLLLRAFLNLWNISTGFVTQNVLTLRMETRFALPPEPAASGITGTSRTGRYFRAIEDRVLQIPGVRAAGFTTALPMQGPGFLGTFTIAGRPPEPEGRRRTTRLRYITPGYFAALGIPLRKGRLFTDGDKAQAASVVLVNEAFVSQHLPNEDPISVILDRGNIVGVVGNVRQSLGLPPDPEIYYSLEQTSYTGATLVVRGNIPPESFIAAVRFAIRDVNANQAVYNVKTMKTVLAESLADLNLHLWLIALFAGLALALSMVGIYGVMSYTVSSRRREFGIRMALGAGRSDVLRLVVGQGFRMTLVGVGIGVLGALASTRFLSFLLFGVKPTDPLTFVAVSLILTAVALLASYIPARRATKVDPMVALRYE